MSGTAWIGLDAEDRDLRLLEHLIHEAAAIVGSEPPFASTNVVASGGRHGAGALCYERLGLGDEEELISWATRRDLGVVVVRPDAPVRSAGPGPRRAGASEAAGCLADRRSGRAVRFPGQDGIPPAVSRSELVRLCAIDRVVALGAAILPTDIIEGADYLRPRFDGGALVLHVTPLRPGRFRPFELAAPHECCAPGAVPARPAPAVRPSPGGSR